MHKSGRQLLCELTRHHISDLERIAHVVTSAMEKWSTDWFGRVGSGMGVVEPRTTAEVSKILKVCHDHSVGVTLLGGSTGLAGGTIAGPGELLVSLARLDKLIDVDSQSSTVTVDGGVILETLQKRLMQAKLVTPYDLGARGSCTVGGNLATHAGGNNFIRYGPLRGHVLGLEVVLADGTILDLMSKSWKDNTALDLKQLFIGSEGCLGVITKARIRCPPLPSHKCAALIHSNKPFDQSVLRALRIARETIGESLSAFEFMDSEGLTVLPALPAGVEPPCSGEVVGFAILVEATGSSSSVLERLETFIAQLGEERGVIASDLAGIAKLWEYRESLPVRMGSLGPNLKFDVSLSQADYYSLVEAVRERYASQVAKIVGYGHVGDGNLHLNIALKGGGADLGIPDFVYAKVGEMGGSVSAEHGIGRDKLSRLHYSKSPESIQYMQKLKALFDPRGILNPGRTIPKPVGPA